MQCIVTFPEAPHEAVHLPEGTNLSEKLSVMNSPLLFGCRTGICGTCLVEVTDPSQRLKPPDTDEVEALAVYAPGNVQARLACRIYLNSDISLKPIGSA